MTTTKNIIKMIASVLIVMSLFTTTVLADEKEYLPSGEIVLISLETKYPYIEYKIDTGDSDSTLQSGDIILSVKAKNKLKVKSLKSIEKILKEENKDIEIEFIRDNHIKLINTTTDTLRKYKISDYLNGVCTLTTIDKDGDFTAMAHSPKLNGTKVEMKSGYVLKASYVQEQKSRAGNVGVIEANNSGEMIGTIEEISDNCVKGKITSKYNKKEGYLKLGSPKVGKAYLYSTAPITNKIETYEIEITEIKDNLAEIRVIDKELLEHRGGLVQGMSGSPVVQDGKIIGGMRLIKIIDPSRGYIVNIEEMINK